MSRESRPHPYIVPPCLRLPAAHLRRQELLPILLDSPHSGLEFPVYARAKKAEIIKRDKYFFKRYADLFMDEIIAPACHAGAAILTTPYARSFIDLNRDFRSDDRHDNRHGDFALFWRRAGGIELWSHLSPRERARRGRWIWHAYHEVLRRHLRDLHSIFGGAVLLDCHSMPAATPGLSGYHVVLGDAHGLTSDKDLVMFVADFFARRGLRSVRNEPFSGGAIIRRHGRAAAPVQALQIEIRRDLYMDEINFGKNKNFNAMGSLFAQLAEELGLYLKNSLSAPALS